MNANILSLIAPLLMHPLGHPDHKMPLRFSPPDPPQEYKSEPRLPANGRFRGMDGRMYVMVVRV